MADKLIKNSIHLLGQDESGDVPPGSTAITPYTQRTIPLLDPVTIKHMIIGAVIYIVASWVIGEL